MVTIDAFKQIINLEVSKNEIDERKKNWKKPKPKYLSGVLAKYASLATSASVGAYTAPLKE